MENQGRVRDIQIENKMQVIRKSSKGMCIILIVRNKSKLIS